MFGLFVYNYANPLKKLILFLVLHKPIYCQIFLLLL